VHPLDVQVLSPFHTWSVCGISFLLVIAAYGLDNMYESQMRTGSKFLVQLRMVATCVGMVIVLTVVTKILTKKYYRERLLVCFCLDELYVDDEGGEHAADDNEASENDSTGKTVKILVFVCPQQVFSHFLSFVLQQKSRDTRRTLPLTILRLLIAAFLLLCNTFVPPFSILFLALVVALPTAIEILIELNHFNVKFRAARLILKASAMVIHETVRAPSMENTSSQVAAEQL